MSRSHNLSEEFIRLRKEDLRSKGRFGALKTLHPNFRQSLEQLFSLFDQPNLSVFLFGEKGSGKEFLAREFHKLTSIYTRLNQASLGYAHLDTNDFHVVSAGFLGPQHFRLPGTLYIENVENLTPLMQQELLKFLRDQKQNQPLRFVFSSSKDMTYFMNPYRFQQELLEAMVSCLVRVPNLKERMDEVPLNFNIPPQLVDQVAQLEFTSNFDGLKAWLDSNPPTKITAKPSSSFRIIDKTDVSEDMDKRSRYQKVLRTYQGHRALAAAKLGLPTREFTEEILRLGIR